MKTQKISIRKVKSNPQNPRIIKDYKFKKLVNSIQQFPKMLEIRPIVVNSDMIVLGGNMRLKASEEAGLKEVWVTQVDDLTPEQQQEFIIKDNSSFGEWDWDILANEWNVEDLKTWGLDVPKWEDVSFDTEIEDTGEYDYPEDSVKGSHVKMVQLFLDTDTEPNFRKWEEFLRTIFKTDNLTDTIYKAIEKMYNDENKS